MPMLRPAQRTSVDWMTGEMVPHLGKWQSEGWLEAQHADELLRTQRVARRSVVATLAADLGEGLRTCLAAVGRSLGLLVRRLSRRPQRG